MSKITVNADCGYAPEKALLSDLNIAFAKADVEGILGYFSDDIRWRIMGAADLHGKAAARKALEEMKDVVTRELVIDSIITQRRDQRRDDNRAGRIGRLPRHLSICVGRW